MEITAYQQLLDFITGTRNMRMSHSNQAAHL